MSKPKLFMMCGLPASGKSHEAQELAAIYNATVFSSDDLRIELFGDVNHQEDNQTMFVELHRRVKECLKSGHSAILDATNTNYKKRIAFLAELKNIACEKICVLMATPYKECLRRNDERERQVPEYVLKRMYMNFNMPYWYEGWDDIHVVYSDGAQNSMGYAGDWIQSVMDFNQDNDHHALTLGEHCQKTYEIVFSYCDNAYNEHEISLCAAAMLHDLGKVFTKTFVNAKGETTGQAHYYSHQCCGAYDSVFFKGLQNKLYTAQLIQWHMHPYMAWTQSEKAMKRDKQLLGDEMFDNIMLLHKADQAAH